ncbi:DoxX family membrane protein [Hymenobacter edaphi]|uniref:DoxX family protein n=1 Tax=Hymenobacter edaphi TaxID=2211146 RepID=A0A328BEI3_9BACT|nr:DoxX family membrane protein [Hymenobacter edaphi]RAK65075.1 DoxX family protein [Hymenobacter edaphi]
MNLTNAQLAFVLGRLLMGVNFLMHGLVRLPKLATFRAGMVKSFADTWLPGPLVGAFATGLPVLEFSVGLLLVLGLFTRWALVGGLLILLALVFGTSLQEQWDTLGTQLVHGLFFYLLLLHADQNRLCLDRRAQ